MHQSQFRKCCMVQTEDCCQLDFWLLCRRKTWFYMFYLGAEESLKGDKSVYNLQVFWVQGERTTKWWGLLCVWTRGFTSIFTQTTAWGQWKREVILFGLWNCLILKVLYMVKLFLIFLSDYTHGYFVFQESEGKKKLTKLTSNWKYARWHLI